MNIKRIISGVLASALTLTAGVFPAQNGSFTPLNAGISASAEDTGASLPYDELNTFSETEDTPAPNNKREPLNYNITDNTENKFHIARSHTAEFYDTDYNIESGFYFESATTYNFLGQLDKLQETVDPSGNIYTVCGIKNKAAVIPEDNTLDSFEIYNDGFSFGGAVIGADNFLYAVWGKDIENDVILDSLDEENIIICKYDMSGKLIKSLGLKVRDTEAQFPFAHGNANLRYKNGVLGIFFDTQFLESKTNDGLNHQGSEFAAVNTDTMELLDFSTWEGSHSFGVSLIETDYGFAGIQRGDSHPRGIALSKYIVDNDGKFKFTGRYTDMFNASGQYGKVGAELDGNPTYMHMGGVAQSASTYAIAGKSERIYTSEVYKDSGLQTNIYDVFVKIADRSLSDTAAEDCAGVDRVDLKTGETANKNIVWLTECNEIEKAGNVKVVTLEDGSYCILWEKFVNDSFDSIRYVITDECGNIIRRETAVYGARLSDTTIQPIVQGDTLTWTVAYGEIIKWYSVNINEYEDAYDPYKELKNYISENNIQVSLKDEQYGIAGDEAYWIYDEPASTLLFCGKGTMYNYGDTTPWLKFNDNIKNAVITDGITGISPRSLNSLENLENVDIPESVIMIGECAFENCLSIKSINIPENVHTLNSRMFRYSKNLSSVTLPSNLINIRRRAFEGSSLNDIKLPDTLKSIESFAFSSTSIKNITFPENLESIGNFAFNYCYSLTDITIPENVKTIGMDAFDGCKTLKNVTIKNKNAEIGKKAFGYAFSEKIDLTICGYAGSTAEKYAKENDFKFIDIENPQPETTPADTILNTGSCGENVTWSLSGSGVLTISGTGDMYDYNDSNNISPFAAVLNGKNKYECKYYFESVVIESGVTSIGAHAFEYNDNIKNITIPDTVTKIRECAFYQCRYLISATLPESVISVEKNAFALCDGLEDITIKNPACDISNEEGTICSSGYMSGGIWKYAFFGIIHGSENSTAESYAKERNYKFSPLEATPAETTTPAAETVTTTTTTTTIAATTAKNTENTAAETTTVINVTTMPPAITTKITTTMIPVTTAGVTSANKPVLIGDISGNGKIDLYDAIEIAKSLIGKRKFTEAEINIADFNGDGKIDLYDAIDIAKYMLKK